MLLRERFGATRVAAFGSLVDPARFFAWSDIDLAVWGVPAALWYRAGFELMGGEFEVNLVDPEHCPAGMRDSIAETGVDVEGHEA